MRQGLWIKLRTASADFQLGIPVKKIPPTLVKIVRREAAAVLLKLERARLSWPSLRMHMRLVRQAVALPEVTGLAGSDDVFPAGPAAARAWNDVVEGQVRRRRTFAAILAAKAIAQEHVEPRKGRPPLLRNEFFQGNDRR